MKTNEELQKDVQDAIKWERLLDAAEVGVTVKDGVVTLTGTVDTYAKKEEAEKATKKVVGVKAVVEEIQVKSYNASRKTDAEIATEVLSALRFSWQIPKDKVQVKVENGWVTLYGELDWHFQKEAARALISNLPDIKWITNSILIKSEAIAKVEKEEVENALKRNWLLENKNIVVSVVQNKVTLHGTVHSWIQKDEATRIAWNAPGIIDVDNQLTIDYL